MVTIENMKSLSRHEVNSLMQKGRILLAIINKNLKKTTTTKKTAKKKTSGIFTIVVWDDDDGDPVKVFNTLEAAKKFVSEDLLQNLNGDCDYVNKSSIKVYQGKLIEVPTVEVVFKV